MNVPLSRLEAILEAMEAVRAQFHQPDSTAKTKAFLDLAWQSGVLTHYVETGRAAGEGQ